MIYTHLAIEYFQLPKVKACQNAQTFIKMKRQSITSSFATKKQSFMDWTVINFVFHLPHNLGENGKNSRTSKMVATQGWHSKDKVSIWCGAVGQYMIVFDPGYHVSAFVLGLRVDSS